LNCAPAQNSYDASQHQIRNNNTMPGYDVRCNKKRKKKKILHLIPSLSDDCSVHYASHQVYFLIHY
jgi:hypothetical protein